MKIKYIAILLILLPVLVFAKNQDASSKAGITPESSFYFFDKLGETIQEFFTFNSEGKARLQITFATERIAEIQVILETKGVEAKGLEIAQSRLQDHLERATTIIAKRKSKGDDVEDLTKDLDDEIEESKSVLSQSFEDEKEQLENKREELKKQIEDAKKAGNTALVQSLTQELQQINSQMEALDDKENELEDDLDNSKEDIDDSDDEDSEDESEQVGQEAQKQIQEAEKKRLEFEIEMQKEGVQIPASLFEEFNNLLNKAKSSFDQGNFGDAEMFAKQAKASLEDVKKEAENIRELQKQESED